jgi:hypothetical protein
MKRSSTHFKLLWVVLLLVTVAAISYYQSNLRTASSEFGKISKVQSYSPDITATVYDSQEGDATVVWVSGLTDFEEGFSQFGEIWQVYSFKPEISATTYNSDGGNATVIWMSGMDYEPIPRYQDSAL